jgi:hypothetical protein
MSMRGIVEGRNRDKTGLVTAAVMFATEDHWTTF